MIISSGITELQLSEAIWALNRIIRTVAIEHIAKDCVCPKCVALEGMNRILEYEKTKKFILSR